MNDEKITTLDMFQLLREDIKSSEARLLADTQKIREDIKSSEARLSECRTYMVWRIDYEKWRKPLLAKSGDNFSKNAHGLAIPNCRRCRCRRCDKGVFLIVSI